MTSIFLKKSITLIVKGLLNAFYYRLLNRSGFPNGVASYSFIVYHCDLVHTYPLVLEHYLQFYCYNTKKLLHTGKLKHQFIGLYKIFVPTFSLPIRITYLYFSVPTKKKVIKALEQETIFKFVSAL